MWVGMRVSGYTDWTGGKGVIVLLEKINLEWNIYFQYWHVFKSVFASVMYDMCLWSACWGYRAPEEMQFRVNPKGSASRAQARWPLNDLSAGAWELNGSHDCLRQQRAERGSVGAQDPKRRGEVRVTTATTLSAVRSLEESPVLVTVAF